MKTLSLLRILPLLYLGLPTMATSQETWQFRVILVSVKDPAVQGGGGTLILSDHSLRMAWLFGRRMRNRRRTHVV